MVPASIFKTRDEKFVALACATEQQFTGLCQAMNREDLLKEKIYTHTLERLKPVNAAALTKIAAEWVKSLTVEDLIQTGQ